MISLPQREVFEHLIDPKDVIDKLWRVLNPGGVMGIMTKLVKDKNAFTKWHYINDPTHITFYSIATMHYISNYLDADFKQVANDAFIFIKRFE